MEIIIYPDHLIDKLQNEGLNQFDLSEIKNDFAFLDKELKLKEINLGTGADWIVIMGVLIGLSNLFIIGDKIDKGIEGWIKIGKRFKSLISKKKVKFIDEDFATILAIEFISTQIQIEQIEKISSSSISYVQNQSLESLKSNFELDKKYLSTYIQSFKINEKEIFILSIKSTGETNQIEKISLN